MAHGLIDHLSRELEALRAHGLYKEERRIASKQAGRIRLASGAEVLNFCANNYLGLANDPRLIQAAKAGLDRWGFGVASVRFICGAQQAHQDLERKIADFLGMEDAILYSSCFDANAGLFEALLGEADAIVSDALNHASIIDGIRLCKAERFRYANADLADLERQLQSARGSRFTMIATDGVFSMDGVIAPIDAICDLAERYGALTMVDDSHAIGVLGQGGRGSIDHCGAQGRVDIVTGTLGKALGGASGGYVAAKKPIVDWLRQRSRPYLFSNSLAPPIVAASSDALEIVEKGEALRERLRANAARFRAAMSERGFALAGADHPIVPVMIGDAALAQRMAARMLELGVYVIGFSYPVVPMGQARIRTQLSAAHTEDDIDRAVEAFARAAGELGGPPFGASSNERTQ